MNYLFICHHNMARSPMAEAFFKKYHPEHEARSAAVNGKYMGELLPIQVWKALYEKGIDLKHHRSKPLTQEYVKESDKIFVLCEKKLCPDYLLKSDKAIYWKIDDPIQGLDSIIEARDNIEERVKRLDLENL